MSAYDSKDVAVSVFKVNLKNSKFKKIIVNKYEINGWVADKQGNIRLGIQLDKDRATSVVERTIWYRKDNNSDMEKLHSRKTFDGETFWPIALNDEATKAYVVSDHQTRRDSLWLFDIVNNKFEKMIYGHEKYDIDGALKNSQGEVIGVYYFDDFKRNYYFDQKSNNLTKTVSNVLKNTDSAHVVSASKDKKRIIAWAQSPNKVPVYYYIDLRNQKAGAWLAQIPQLVKQPMMTTQNIEFKARDGKIIPGYLTIPQGVEKPALVVLPHGGPNARDYRYFDPIKQFIAAKGHAVLQVNFRGSTGFGSDFETDGYMGWGKQMQQDIYDGMDYVVENFSVSKKDACVVGFSYGGYVALTSAFQEPNRFDCVASISGISDVKELVKDENNWFFDLNNIVDMSDSKAIDELEHVSAINHIDRIKSPVLLIHGTKDTQVHHTQSSDFYDQAKKKVDVDYVEIKDGTHYFDDKESRKILFKELSAFLDKHL
ncbi:S9 family peptidase [Shewanella sp. OPT22]|nr:S9 family peptidase [Shewanella sp. OPT22]